jgi:hypothetical protein
MRILDEKLRVSSSAMRTGRRPFRTLLRPGAGRFPQQKVFQNKLPFAGDEWSTANTACRFEIDDFRLRFCSDDLVQGIAVWAAEKRRFVRIRHERPQHFCFASRGEHCAARSKAGDLSQSESPHRLFALIHFRIRLRVRNTDHKTTVEKSMNDGSAIGGSCRGELRVIRFGHCHAALPTVEGPQFRKSAGGDRSH